MLLPCSVERMVAIRAIAEADYDLIAAHLDEWWGGRSMLEMLPRLFFTHFANTSFVVEDNAEGPGDGGSIVGFLIGFPSPAVPDQAYVHFVGVHPEHRGQGIAQQLYERFSEEAVGAGRSVLRCVTSPVNRGSIAFHTGLGFQTLPGDAESDGVPVRSDYDGPGQDRVVFEKRIGR